MKLAQKSVIYGIIITFAAVFFTACGDPIPIKEMTDAKKAISRAYTVKGDTYAKDELKAAEESLLKCHDFIKTDELDKAKESAVRSREKAEEAYNKSLPLLAGDTIHIAEESLNEAAEASSERLAKDEFVKANELLTKANEQFQNKSYVDARDTAVQADENAKQARNLAIGRKDVLGDAINEVKYTIDQAGRYNAEKYAFEKFSLAKENLKSAEDFYKDLKLKQGFASVEVAKINADEAYQGALEGSAQDSIQQADAYLASAEKSEGAGLAKDELAASRESLDNARAMFGETRYKESMDYASESMKLSRIVMDTKKPVETDASASTALAADTAADKDKADSKPAVAEEEKDYDIYRVVYREKLKDCLWRIADKYYGNPWLWKKIYEANRDRIKNPDLIYPGWLLKIPRIK